ncbi:MAG: hypothetical protein HY287_05760 [Planctomycetes bacterium]|nr:hypothetical protein [Planctomycetota bacterium]MBI3833817.1 hypothetical protein [Planctomycetota bacterium]
MTHRRAIRSALATTIVFAAFTAASADQLVVSKVNYMSARLMNVEVGQIVFRSSDGAVHREWLSDVDLILIEHGGTFDDFNQAERMAAAGEPDKAAVRYERAMRLADEAWADMTAARLLRVYDRSGQFEKTAAMFVRVAQGKRTGPALAARMFPHEAPTKKDAKFARAMETLDAALAAEPGEGIRVVVEALRFEWLRQVGDVRANRIARGFPAMPIPENVGTESLYRIVREALGVWMEKEASPTAMDALDASIRDCPAANLPDFLMLKGDVLSRSAQTREEMIRASWPYLRIAIHMADDPRAADALFAAAGLMQRLERPNWAASLTDECLAHPRISASTKARATAFRSDVIRASGTP